MTFDVKREEFNIKKYFLASLKKYSPGQHLFLFIYYFPFFNKNVFEESTWLSVLRVNREFREQKPVFSLCSICRHLASDFDSNAAYYLKVVIIL